MNIDQAAFARLQLRRDLIDTVRRANALGINRGASGNASVRCGRDFLVTPSAVPYDTMEPDDIVAMRFDGSWEAGRDDRRPSSEWRFHRDILAARPDVEAVVHVHSAAASALACLRRDIPPFHYMVAVAGGTTIRCSRYATFGTQALSDAVLEALDGRTACLIANHGQIATGGSLEAALALAVEVESLAETYWRAAQVGEPVLLDDDEMARVLDRFARYRRGEALD